MEIFIKNSIGTPRYGALKVSETEKTRQVKKKKNKEKHYRFLEFLKNPWIAPDLMEHQHSIHGRMVEL